MIKQYIYGLEASDTDNIDKSFVIKCDAELKGIALTEIADAFSKLLNKTPDEVLDALFLYENTDGTPCQQADLYEAIENRTTQAERMANLQALQDEAEEECK